MMNPLNADLEIPAVRVLHAEERERILQAPHIVTLPELCTRANIRCRVTGGRVTRTVLWDGPGHGIALTTDHHTIFAIEQAKLPASDPERALRILEILAYGCFDYATRESICGRGYFR